MKKILMALLAVFMLISGANAQDTLHDLTPKEYRKLKRQERKLAREQELLESREKIIAMVHDTAFVLEVNTFIGLRGQTESVSYLTNFFAADGADAVIQFSFDHIVGLNELGGFPNHGTLIQYKVESDNPKRPIIVLGRFRLTSGAGNIPFELAIQDNGSARLSLTNRRQRQITLSGRLVSPDETSVYKGTRLFKE
ncbi:MAG: DUF4251 domain-containing protein [Bacteroidales bacterium]|nr:DUF4251 domain-containing protein [Bacteroidales bacterium]